MESTPAEGGRDLDACSTTLDDAWLAGLDRGLGCPFPFPFPLPPSPFPPLSPKDGEGCSVCGTRTARQTPRGGGGTTSAEVEGERPRLEGGTRTQGMAASVSRASSRASGPAAVGRRRVAAAAAAPGPRGPGPAAAAPASRRELLLLAGGGATAAAAAGALIPAGAARAGPASFYDFTVQQYGEPTSLAAFRGKVSVVVNVASE